MSPKMKTRDVKMRSCRKNKTKETAPIKSPLKMTKPKRRIMQKTSKDKKNVKSVPSASTASCVPTEENKNAENEEHVIKYLFNAYKDYENLKKKKFSTGFKNENPRRYKFTNEKDNDPKWKENFPAVRNTKPGESYAKYHDIFMSLSGLSDSDEEIVKTDRKGRKKAEELKNAEKELKNAEKELKNAEKERKNAEKERKNAEKERKNAERERKNAERERKNAERERKKAHKERMKAYKELIKAYKEHGKELERERKKKKRMMSYMMKYCLNSYKQSPDYQNLKKKKFNTSFIHQTPRRHEIEIFTPEENNDPKWNLPAVRNTITGEPGESHAKYHDIFMSLPGLSDSDEEPEEIVKTKGMRGRKKAVGYNA